jgi:hypothetical protein
VLGGDNFPPFFHKKYHFLLFVALALYTFSMLTMSIVSGTAHIVTWCK